MPLEGQSFPTKQTREPQKLCVATKFPRPLIFVTESLELNYEKLIQVPGLIQFLPKIPKRLFQR